MKQFSPILGIPVTLLLLFSWQPPCRAQQNNPLINSGELIAQASVLHDSGEFKKAIHLYEQIDRNDTNYTRALYEMALSYSADSQFNKAIQVCEKALSLESDQWEPALYTEYASLLDKNEPDRALRLFDSAIHKYPAYSPLYMNKGTTLLRLERLKEAEAVFQQALLIDPYSYSSHFKLGVAALKQGKTIPAFLCFIGYLLLSPDGRYHQNCINLLSSISKNEDNIREYLDKRKEACPEDYQLTEQIVQSKIALDKNYKAVLRLDDPISRQIQVVFEKLAYEETDNDFYIQYYLPFYKNIFSEGKFEYFINHVFSDVNLPIIQQFNKKNKKELHAFVVEAAEYFNLIRSSRELNYKKRNLNGAAWYFSKGNLVGKGKAINNGDKLTGPWEFYYASGNTSARVQFNEKGEKEGAYTAYYFDGKVKGNKLFRDGKQEGDEIFYYNDGVLSSSARYRNNLEEDADTSYYPVGIPQTISHLKAGKLEGEKTFYYASGFVHKIAHYSADELNGPLQSWFQNGVLEYTANYANAKLEGPYKKYFENGQLAIEGQYSKDQLSGTWKYYHDNGQFKDEQTFVDGRQEGEYKEYHPNGKLYISYQFKKGKINGEARYYDDDEKLFSIIFYENDQMKTARYFDKNGKQISQSDRKSKTLDLTTFLPDGSKRLQGFYNGKGNTEGTETLFYPSGATSEANEYRDGVLNGKSITYYPNGHIKSETAYLKGDKDGYYQSYFSNGQVQVEGWYKAGQAQGSWLYYNELGKLVTKKYFYNDDLDGYKEEYFPNGRMEYETKYKAGWIKELIQYDSTGKELQHLRFPGGTGKMVLRYPNGKSLLSGNYVHGNLDGAYTFYYFDGSLQASQYYKKGMQDSLYKSYYHGGVLSVEGRYKMGDKTGSWKYYRLDGKLGHTEEYKNGKLTGKKIFYFGNGKPDTEISYVDDDRDGPTKKYDEDGSLVYVINYKEGSPVSYTYQDKNGQLLPEILLPFHSGKAKTYYSNGKPSAEFEYKDGKTVGADILYHSNGKVWTSSMEDYGDSEGGYKAYYSNGQLKFDYSYLHDNMHGAYKEYNEKGVLTEEGTFYNGNPHGIIKLYNDNGSLKETDTYYYGKLLSAKK